MMSAIDLLIFHMKKKMSVQKISIIYISFIVIFSAVLGLTGCQGEDNKAGTDNISQVLSADVIASDKATTKALELLPKKRVIIHFSKPLIESEKTDVTNFFKEYGVEDIELASSSHEKRWIVILPEGFAAELISKVCSGLSEKPYVMAVEPDKLMSIK